METGHSAYVSSINITTMTKYATNHSIILCKNGCKIGKTGWFSLLGKAL
jgi:hypothetical protein